MSKEHRDKLQSELRQLREIPFPESLRSSILEEAKQMDPPVRSRSRRRRTWKPWLAAVGGVGTAAALLITVVGHRPHPVEPKLSAAAQPAAYDLQKSGLHVLSIQIGTVPGEPKDSSVIATVKNTSSHTINRTNVFGVLAFPKSVAQKTLLSSDSLTFVNGPQTPIAPGQTGKWSFHPVGAPHDATTQGLTEQPYLVFYQSGLKQSALKNSQTQNGTAKTTASQSSMTMWKYSGLQVEHVSVNIRSKGKQAQAFTVKAELKNPTHRKIDVTKLWGVVWFQNQAQGQRPWDWSAPGDTRFISSPSTNSSQYIAPGQTLEVYFDLVGSSKSDFLNKTPHVAIIQR